MTTFLWPHTMYCTACLSSWNRMPRGVDPATMEIGGLIICETCGHCMVMRPGWVLGDLTKAEAAEVERHPNFPTIRAMQEKVCARMVG